MKNCSDDELLYLMRMGNQDAIDYFYTKYYKDVTQWVSGFIKIGHLSVDVEDCVQEAMMNFSMILDSYRDDKNTSVRTFMKQSVIRRVINYMKYGKDRRIIQDFAIISLDEKSGDEDSYKYEELIEDSSYKYKPLERVLIKEECARYCDEAKKLASNKEIEIMKLILKGYSIKEVAKIKNIPVKSVYNAIYRYSKKMNH